MGTIDAKVRSGPIRLRKVTAMFKGKPKAVAELTQLPYERVKHLIRSPIRPPGTKVK